MKKLPRSLRRSRFDGLLEHVDGNVVALVRGEDYDKNLGHPELRSHLFSWAASRGVRIATRISWPHPTTGKPSPFEREGKALPHGIYVQVMSQNGGRGGSPGKGSAKAKKRRPRRAASS